MEVEVEEEGVEVDEVIHNSYDLMLGFSNELIKLVEGKVDGVGTFQLNEGVRTSRF